jgi:hypothetical protein
VSGQLGAFGTNEYCPVVAQTDWHSCGLDTQLICRFAWSATHWHIPIAGAVGMTGAAAAGGGGAATGRESRGAATEYPGAPARKHAASSTASAVRRALPGPAAGRWWAQIMSGGPGKTGRR